MRQSTFALRNVYDKLTKVIGDWDTFVFYWHHYVLGQLQTVEPDTYVVSYPKCGRTWLRVLLQQYFNLLHLPLQHYHDKALIGVADQHVVKFYHDQGNWVPAPPRIDQLRFNTTKYAGKRVVFMVRDPRDVLVSSWYHLHYRERIYTGTLSAFIRDDLVGIDKIIAFMNLWLDHSHVPAGFYLLTYEQMHAAPTATLADLLVFMDLPVDSEIIAQAVAESTFKKMKRMEQEGALREPWMKPGAKHLNAAMKVRRGKVGSYREELTKADIAFINDRLRMHLSDALPYADVAR